MDTFQAKQAVLRHKNATMSARHYRFETATDIPFPHPKRKGPYNPSKMIIMKMLLSSTPSVVWGESLQKLSSWLLQCESVQADHVLGELIETKSALHVIETFSPLYPSRSLVLTMLKVGTKCHIIESSYWFCRRK